MKTHEKFFYTIFLIAVGVLYTSCCPMNPQLNSVKTAHGNTDWHIDTAEEFLTGEDMDGHATATNHCPDTWTKTHMHVGLTNTRDFYYDAGNVASGNDNDINSGIDRAMLFFYAGHGNPTLFNTLGNSATLPNMRLGNCEDDNSGILRYYWQCSCAVFAHGPRDCPGETEHYTCPEDFDGSPDSPTMRNVFERWGPILSPELRMACGSSSSAYCHQTETNKIWDYYNNQGYEVADAFIFGLHRLSWNTPLCITTGGWSTASTPLFDQTFTNQANPSGAFLHIQYLSSFDNNVPMIVFPIPEMIPIYYLEPMPMPERLMRLELQEKEDWSYSKTKLKERGIPSMKINNNSGAIYVAGERRFEDGARVLSEDEYLKIADEFMRGQGWTEEQISKARGEKLMVSKSPIEGTRGEKPESSLKSVVVSYDRQLYLGDNPVNNVGEGGKISIQMNGDGSIYNASKVWRKVSKVKTTTQAKPYERAYEEALRQVREQGAYVLDSWTWGYEELAGNVAQREMRAVYVFNFTPEDKEKALDYPPMAVKISAHME